VRAEETFDTEAANDCWSCQLWLGLTGPILAVSTGLDADVADVKLMTADQDCMLHTYAAKLILLFSC